MQRDYETQIWLVIDEGILSREESAALLEEALRLGRSPLELLRERGRISEETLASLVKEGPTPPSRETGTPTFPLPHWDRYQFVRFLGQGGMGRVFLANDPRLRRPVALKFVRDDDDAHTRRFISEARAQAKVKHARVCQVYEVGHVDGKVFIAMQYIDGQPLSALARSLTVEQKALVLREAALGVQEAHRVGLIHRDLKPSNIMVERAEDGTPRPYVMDFGLAREWNESTTASGAVLGTPHYMAPEQARGEVSRLDRRADVYSLGASLYFLLTGQHPIPGDNGLEVLNNIASMEPRPPRRVDPDVPSDLEAIALKCLEKDRSARYDSARALAEDLERFLGGEPVLARTGFGYRVRKRLRQHRLLASVSALALLAVSVALGWGALGRREAAERERTVQRFTELVSHIESMVRYSSLSRLHDTREDRQAIQARMAELEAEIQRAGPRALGPGHYALGRGYLALGEEAKALELLESAWRNGFHDPRAAYALALVTGRLYQQKLLEAQRLRSTQQREASTRDAERRYRDPALSWLQRSQGAQMPSAEYVSALVAFYEGRLDDALSLLENASRRVPWFHELPLLRGDILQARALKRWNTGDLEGARKDFEAGRTSFATAAATAESDPAVYRSLAGLENSAMVVELYGKGEVLPAYQRALEALSRCLTVMPDDIACLIRMARVNHRLAEQRLTQGGDGAELLAKALEAAERARAVDPTRSETTYTLARSTWLAARHQLEKGEDPRTLLGRAAALFGSIREADRDRAYHGDSGLVFTTWADYEDQLGVDSWGHRDEAIRAYEAALAMAPLPEDWINLGSAFLTRASLPRNAQGEQDLQKAAEALEKARALNPQHVVPYFYAGQVHEQLARRRRGRGEDLQPELELALEQYRRGLAINPKLPHLHNGMGVVLLLRAEDVWNRGGDPLPVLEEARASFGQAIAVAPGQGFGYANLGSLLVRRGNYLLARGEDPRPSAREAEPLLKQGLERMPGASWLYGLMGTVHVTLARHEAAHGRAPDAELARAGKALHAAMEQNPQDAELWLQLGKAQALRHQDLEDAAKSFEKAITLSPDEQEYRLEAGVFHALWAAQRRRAGQEDGPQLQRGLELAEQVLKARPDWAVAHALHASLRLKQAETASPELQRASRAQALKELTQALASNPNLTHEWGGPLSVAQSPGAGP
ncbi:serine/threonine-protein kinase [Corallococcus sp. M7]